MYLVMYGYSYSNKIWLFHDKESAIIHCLDLASSQGYSFSYSEILNALLYEGIWNHFPFTVKKCY